MATKGCLFAIRKYIRALHDLELPFTATRNPWVFWPLAILCLIPPFAFKAEWVLGVYLSLWLQRKGRSAYPFYCFLAFVPLAEGVRFFHGMSTERTVYASGVCAAWFVLNLLLSRELLRYLIAELSWKPRISVLGLLGPFFINEAIIPPESSRTPQPQESPLVTLKLS